MRKNPFFVVFLAFLRLFMIITLILYGKKYTAKIKSINIYHLPEINNSLLDSSN